jgi:sterol desaturase/sphingolipid hydroxylase (fatty acid hydroxylase superfamily)
MADRKAWLLIYGGAFAVLLAVCVLAVASHPHALWQEAINSARSLVDMSGNGPDRSVEAVPAVLGLFAFFSLLERVLPAAGPRKPLRGYWLNFKVTLLEYVTIPILGGLTSVAVIALGKRLGLGWIDLRFSTGHGMMDLLLGFLLSTFIFDFFFYWYHRFQHESFLWQEHKLHHMDEQLCAFYRESWLETLISGPLSAIPLAILFKLNPEQGAITGTIFTAWVVFIHTNIRLHLGPFAVLFNAPQGHRIHHSRMREHFDQNFAAFFPIWDVLFGTYHYPKRDEYPSTGVHGEKEVQTLWEGATLAFREWHRMFRAWRHRHDSLPA